MPLDWYTKVVLTIIALALVGNLVKPVVTPPPVIAQASVGKFDHLRPYTGAFFDTRTGDIWSFDDEDKPVSVGRLVELGKPLQKVK